MTENVDRNTSTGIGRAKILNWEPPGCHSKVYDSILHTIGNTPMVRLNKIPKDHGLECQMFAKCEFFNPGGSIKDRIAYSMTIDAENRGVTTPRTLIVEPTSGNTGIGMSLVSNLHEYKCTIVLPDKNSAEKINTMKLLGAHVIQTPSRLKHTDPGSFMKVVEKILKENPDAVSLNQYGNKVNPETHYEFTANEIISAMGKVDMIVAGTGTGGTLNGLVHRMKEVNPNCLVVAVDPEGSILFDCTKQKPYLVEGIGGDFIPDVLDKKVDRFEKPNDCESFNMAREVIRKEGILCGGSSGAAMFAAIKAAKALKLGADHRVVVIFPDSIRNYMSKFVSDQWMEANFFKKPPVHEGIKWWSKSISNLKILEVPMIKENEKCSKALEAMGSQHNIAIVIDENEKYVGAISKDSLRHAATNPSMVENINFDDPVSHHVIKCAYKIDTNRDDTPTVGLVSRMLDITPFVVIGKQDPADVAETFTPKGILTPEIVLDYIQKYQNEV